jgi:hypothetical protein
MITFTLDNKQVTAEEAEAAWDEARPLPPRPACTLKCGCTVPAPRSAPGRTCRAHGRQVITS